jgi:Fe-S-cluster containining protein
MIDLIEQWKQNKKRKKDENFDFLMWLKIYKSSGQADKIAKESHNEVFSIIDCTKCANCCKTVSPGVGKADVERISSFLQISEQAFIEKYLTTGDEQEYEMNALPCPFLKDDKCSIYEVRPTVCREYPHTDKKGFTTRKYMHSGNTEICPAVYHIFETMKDRFNWRKRR